MLGNDSRSGKRKETSTIYLLGADTGGKGRIYSVFLVCSAGDVEIHHHVIFSILFRMPCRIGKFLSSDGGAMTLNPQDFRLDWDKLKTFYYIAKMGNITKAAEFLRFSQSALSKSLKILEDRLQTRLFYRETGGLKLTEKGEALLKIVEKCYLEMQQVKEIMNEDNRLQGNLKVAISAELSSFSLITSLSEFLKQYPMISLSIEETGHIPAFDLSEGKILIHPFIKEREDLSQHLLRTITYGLYGSKAYFDQFGIPQSLEGLKDHQLIGSRVTATLFPDIADFEMIKNQKEGKLLIEINSVAARIQLAVQGLGIVAAPQDRPALKQGNLIRILPDLSNPILEIFYIYSKQFEPLKRIKVFEDYLKTKFHE